jgi:hypothetical protein
MKSRVAENAHKLRLLAAAPPKNRKRLLQLADRGVVDAISECSRNIIKGNVDLAPSQFNRLRKHRTALRQLARKSGLSVQKRKQIIQRGGFLPALIPLIGTLASTVGSLLFPQQR